METKSNPLSDRQAQEGADAAASETPRLVTLINEYLGNGGFFNPEMMDHDKVRDLLMDCRYELTASLAATQKAQEELAERREAMAEQGKWNLALREQLTKALVERDGALHSSESWELLHAKRQEELAAMTKERDELLPDATILRDIKALYLNSGNKPVCNCTKFYGGLGFEPWSGCPIHGNNARLDDKQLLSLLEGELHNVRAQLATATEQLKEAQEAVQFQVGLRQKFHGERNELLVACYTAESRARTAEAAVKSPRIYTRCPSCGNDTLTINGDKHLLCTWISCKDPTLIDRRPRLLAELAEAKKDTELVDWMEANPEHPSFPTYQDGQWGFLFLCGPKSMLDDGVIFVAFLSLREALRAVIAQKEGK